VSRRAARVIAAVALVALGGCTIVRRDGVPAAPPDAILAALAARERAHRDLCITMRLRTGASPLGALVASPAYLAITDPEHLRLQVLSPFGVTVADLTIDGDRYELRLPMRNERRSGTIDAARLSAPDAGADRMLIALALLFRPRTRTAGCVAGAATVTCRQDSLTIEVSVDDALRPIRERFLAPDGAEVLRVEYGDYDESARGVVPGRIAIEDRLGGAAMAGTIQRVRACQPPQSRLDTSG
jgi:hypothetical protein